MICFDCASEKKIKRLPRRYSDLLRYEVPFRITINGKLFFGDENFPILEFLWQVRKWKAGDEFSFCSIETEENPLLYFQIVSDQEPRYQVSSVWQHFSCDELFTEEELRRAILNLTD